MKLKQKNRTRFAIIAAAAALLIGIGIQLFLAEAEDRRSRREAEQALSMLDGRFAAAAEQSEEELAALAATLEGSRAAKLEHQRQLEKLEILILVNPWNTIPEDYVPELEEISTGQSMDVRCAGALLQMVEDCREAGYYPYICSAYRTEALQRLLFQNKISRVIRSGVSPEEAPAVAAMSVAVPGTSEHQLGLAADIIDSFYTRLDRGQEDTGTQKWLMENCWRYGFILRYPNDTTDITGIIYEPWHYRYVGEEFAGEIHELGVTLEEYLQLRRGR